MVGLLIEANLFGTTKDDEECDYDHPFVDDSSRQGGDKENFHVGEDNSTLCKDVVIIDTELVQLKAKNDDMKMWSCKVKILTCLGCCN